MLPGPLMTLPKISSLFLRSDIIGVSDIADGKQYEIYRDHGRISLFNIKRSESSYILHESVENCFTVLWFTQSNQNKFIIDGDEYVFSKNEIAFLTEFHKISIDKL